MKQHKILGLLGASVLVGSSLVQAAPAHALAGVNVSSPSCGKIRVANTNTTAKAVAFDSRHLVTVAANTTDDFTDAPAGSYVFTVGTPAKDASGQPTMTKASAGAGRVNVAACSSSSPRRPIEGDQTGDGKADVMGIQTGSGNLYFYRMTGTVLAPGVKVGSGWNAMVYMQQVNEIEGQGTPNKVIAVRNDGTLWSYNNGGQGRLSSGVQIGHGFGGYTGFSIVQLNNTAFFGGHMLVAKKGDQLLAWSLSNNGVGREFSGAVLGTGFTTTTRVISVGDFDGDNIAELLTIRKDGTLWKNDFNETIDGRPMLKAPVRVGSSWNSMSTVSSPGSLNGDKLSDVIARRSDGNLYKYINRGNALGTAVKIGANWQAIRLLA